MDAVTVFENRLADLGLDVVWSNNRDLVLFLYSEEMAIIMTGNKLKIQRTLEKFLKTAEKPEETFTNS